MATFRSIVEDRTTPIVLAKFYTKLGADRLNAKGFWGF